MTTLRKTLLTIATVSLSLGCSSMAMAATTDCKSFYNSRNSFENPANLTDLDEACYQDDSTGTPTNTEDSSTLAHNRFIADFMKSCATNCTDDPNGTLPIKATTFTPLNPRHAEQSAMQATSPYSTQKNTNTMPAASFFPTAPTPSMQKTSPPENNTNSSSNTTQQQSNQKIKWF